MATSEFNRRVTGAWLEDHDPGDRRLLNIGDLENHVHGLGTPEDLDIFRKNERSAIFLETVKKNLHLVGLDHE